MRTRAILSGIKFLLTICRVETPAISDTAMITPATGDTVRPMEAENCMGSIIEVLLTPNALAIFGTNGPNAKKEALPLPISIEAKKIMTDITMLMPMALSPKF